MGVVLSLQFEGDTKSQLQIAKKREALDVFETPQKNQKQGPKELAKTLQVVWSALGGWLAGGYRPRPLSAFDISYHISTKMINSIINWRSNDNSTYLLPRPI